MRSGRSFIEGGILDPITTASHWTEMRLTPMSTTRKHESMKARKYGGHVDFRQQSCLYHYCIIVSLDLLYLVSGQFKLNLILSRSKC